MCRYALYGPYKAHWACFDCCKALRRKVADDADGAVEAGKLIAPAKCPQCQQAMVDMGLDFKAPPKTDAKQWAKVRVLAAHGFTYHSCGCGPGLRPEELSQVPQFLAEDLPRTEGEELLELIALRSSQRRPPARRSTNAGLRLIRYSYVKPENGEIGESASRRRNLEAVALRSGDTTLQATVSWATVRPPQLKATYNCRAATESTPICLLT